MTRSRRPSAQTTAVVLALAEAAQTLTSADPAKGPIPKEGS